MKKVEKILAALDLSETDEDVLKWANYFAKHLDAKQMTSGHVVPVLLVGGLIKVAVGEILVPVAPALGRIHKDLEKKTKEWVDMDNLEIMVTLVEGRPYHELLKILEGSEIDLLIMGKKKLKSGSGITAKRIVRHAKCDVLFVPEGYNPEIKRIVVAMDFSEHSFRGIDLAIQLASKLDMEEKPLCLNVIDLATYSGDDNGKPFLDVSDKLPPMINNEFEEFLLNYPVASDKIRCQFVKTKDHNIAKTIRNFAKLKKADLIIMGARGHSAIERFLVGSVAEAMVDAEFEIPVYIVR